MASRGQQRAWPLRELSKPWQSLCLLWVFSVSAQFQRVKLCCVPSDLPLFCCRSYSSTSIEEAMKRGEDPPTPPPRPQKTHSRASSLDLNKVFQPSVPGEVPLCAQPFPFLLESLDGCHCRDLCGSRERADLARTAFTWLAHRYHVCLEPCPHLLWTRNCEILYPEDENASSPDSPLSAWPGSCSLHRGNLCPGLPSVISSDAYAVFCERSRWSMPGQNFLHFILLVKILCPPGLMLKGALLSKSD